ncbi:MAG: cell division ATP-binding protein FtsE [Burkholderiales bacterium]
MISANLVCKRYPGGLEALKHLNFKIGAGELVGISGHSGAGKSTLLKLLAAIERPTSGSLIVNGQNTASLRAPAIPYLRRHFGLVFQDQKLLFERTVFENVLLPLQITSFDRRESAKRARAALDKVGLLNKEKAMPITLSGGEQQRLCIARAIVGRPAILLADEPTSNLDAAYAADIMALFKSFNQVGVTVIIASHDETMLAQLGPRMLKLQHGELIQ